MDSSTSLRKVRLVATFYTLYAIYYLIAASLVIATIGWDQVRHNQGFFISTAVLLVAAIVLNTLLAIGALRLPTINPRTRRLLLSGAVLLAITFVISNLAAFVQWLTTSPHPNFGLFNVITSVSFALGYVYCAYVLARLATMWKQARPTGARA